MDRVLDNLQQQQDKQSQIVEGSKLLAEYLEWEYFPFNNLQGLKKAGWYYVSAPSNPIIANSMLIKGGYQKTDDDRIVKFLYRSHKDLRFFNNYDWLFEVIEKLEKEDLKDYFDEGNFMAVSVDRYDTVWDASVSLSFDPPFWLSGGDGKYRHLPDREQLFRVLVDAIKKVQEIKNRNNE